MSKPRVNRSKSYKSWHKSLIEKEKRIVDTRVDKYRLQNELINYKSLDPEYGLFEFKWDSGLRVYFSIIEDKDGKLMLLLLGGNKNSQDSDITEAKNIVSKAVNKIVAKKKKTTKKVTTKKKGKRI